MDKLQNLAAFDNPNRQYVCPIVGDHVIGIVEDKTSEQYRLNIFGSSPAFLNKLGFEGATKRNKPELKRGDVVYCRVTTAHKDMDTEVSCLATSGWKRDWSSGETIFGPLSDGLVVRVSQKLATDMLTVGSAVLNKLGSQLSFEIAIGMNGAVWFNASNVIDTIVIRNALLNAEYLVPFPSSLASDGTVPVNVVNEVQNNTVISAMVDNLVLKGKEKTAIYSFADNN